MLVAVAYYIGEEKAFDGMFFFTILIAITLIAMVSSEIIALRMKRKVSPLPVHPKNNQSQTKLVISNLIPFTNLNVIISLSIFLATLIKLVVPTQSGVPTIAIHQTIIIICLLATNDSAKMQVKKKLSSVLGIRLTENQNTAIEKKEQRDDQAESVV